MADRTVQSVQQLTSSWTVRGSDPSGGDIFQTYPDQPQGPSSLIYDGY